MKYRLDVTVNWKDGGEWTIHCHPQSLYNLKKVVGDFVRDTRDASSFVFVVVCESHELQLEADDTSSVSGCN